MKANVMRDSLLLLAVVMVIILCLMLGKGVS